MARVLIVFFTTLICYMTSGDLLGAVAGFFVSYWITGMVGGLEKKTIHGKANIDPGILEAIVEMSLLVMTADSHMMKSELYLFKEFILRNFGKEAASLAITYLQEIKDQDIPLDSTISKIRDDISYTEKMQILQFLFQLAYVDGQIDQREVQQIMHIASRLGVSQYDFIRLKATFEMRYNQGQQQQSSYSNRRSYQSSTNRDALSEAYATLGVKSTDDDEVIKKAYRSLAIANHPDKVQHLGETARLKAEKRFREINNAYDIIKKHRNL